MEYINIIEQYNPYNEQEKKDKEVILKYASHFDNLPTRDNEFAHFTSSSLLVNKKRDKALMIYHNLYNSWGWTGGHADGDPDFLAVAIREAKEETGVQNITPITKDIFSLDILPVWGHFKRGQYVSAHQHLSLCYLLEADENEPLVIKPDENSGVKWVPIEEFCAASTELEMKLVYQKLIDKLHQLDVKKL